MDKIVNKINSLLGQDFRLIISLFLLTFFISNINCAATILKETKPKIEFNRIDLDFRNAVEKNELPLVEKLAVAGANINSMDNLGLTPLVLAIRKKNLEMVKSLIKLGGTVNIIFQRFSTPLAMAVMTNELDIAKTLLSAKADPNLSNNFTESPLYWAIRNNNTAAVRLLLENGANVNLEDKEKHIDIVTGLIDRPNMYYGENSALSYAMSKKIKNNDIIRLLLDAGADITLIYNQILDTSEDMGTDYSKEDTIIREPDRRQAIVKRNAEIKKLVHEKGIPLDLADIVSSYLKSPAEYDEVISGIQ